MHILLILSRMTNLIITCSFVVVCCYPALFLVFQVSVKGWKGNLVLHYRNWFSKRKDTNDHFSQFWLLILPFHVCRSIILTLKNFFLEFHWSFPKFKEIVKNVVFFGNFVLKIEKCRYTVHFLFLTMTIISSENNLSQTKSSSLELREKVYTYIS